MIFSSLASAAVGRDYKTIYSIHPGSANDFPYVFSVTKVFTAAVRSYYH